jgi:O-antigen/teichoic acid export membrane protein
MKDRIAKAVFWIGWSKGLVQLLSFLSTLYIARLLTPNDYGLVAMTGIWVGSLTLLVEMGLGSAVIQFQNLDERELNMCFWGTLGTAIAGYLLLYAAAPAIADWFGIPLFCEVLRVVSLTLPLTAVRIIPYSLLRKALALDKTSQAEIVSVVVSVPVQVMMAALGCGVWTLVTGMLLMAFTQSLVTFKFSSWRPGIRMGSLRLKAILGFSSVRLGGNVCWAVYDQMDALVLGKISGDGVLGVFSMAKQLALLPVLKISVVVNQLGFPLMAGIQDNVEEMRSLLLRQIRIVACLTFPLCIGLGLVAEDLVWVALTEKWLPLVPVLQVLCFSSVLRSLQTLLPPVLTARYRAAVLFWWAAGLVLVMPFAFWVGTVWSGALGVAVAWAIVYPAMTVWMVQKAFAELSLSWNGIMAEVAPILKATVAMAILVTMVHSTVHVDDTMSHLLRLILAVGTGAFVYLGLILWQGGRLAGEFMQLGRWVLGRT